MPIVPPSPTPLPPTWIQRVLSDILGYVKTINDKVDANQRTIIKRLDSLKQADQVNSDELAALANAQLNMANAQLSMANALSTLVTTDTEDSVSIATILKILTTPPPPAPAVAFQVELVTETELNKQGENKMAKTIKFKINILDNGTAQGVISGIVDAAGLPTTFDTGTIPTWVCETTPGAGQDPNIVLTPAADGMSCVIAPATPPVLVSGDIVTVTATGPVMGTLTGTYSPVNIVAGPAGSFVVSVS